MGNVHKASIIEEDDLCKTLCTTHRGSCLSQQRHLAKRFILEMNWSSYPQQGTFYFFPKIPKMEEFSKQAEDNGIFILQGDAFGAGYKDHFRLCFAKPMSELQMIFDKLDSAFDEK